MHKPCGWGSVHAFCLCRDFSQCLKLQELYLRKNEVQQHDRGICCITLHHKLLSTDAFGLQVAEVTEVQWLAHLPDLRVLWLSDNPCAEISSYRQKV